MSTWRTVNCQEHSVIRKGGKLVQASGWDGNVSSPPATEILLMLAQHMSQGSLIVAGLCMCMSLAYVHECPRATEWTSASAATNS